MNRRLKKRPNEEVATRFMKQTDRGNTPVSSLFINKLPSKHSLFTNSTIERIA
jgi:amino acid permease